MKNKSESEKRLLRTIRSVIGALSFVLAIVYSIFIMLNGTLTKGNALLIILGILTLQILLFLFKGDWIMKITFKAIRRFNKNSMAGRWNIIIEYTNKDYRTVERYGTLKIQDSYLGLYIKGDALLDKVSDTLEVENWESSYADTFTYEKNKILFYQYITYDDGDLSNPTKTGIVNAKKENEGIYKGVFKDFEVDTGKEIRAGKVTIYKTQ